MSFSDNTSRLKRKHLYNVQHIHQWITDAGHWQVYWTNYKVKGSAQSEGKHEDAIVQLEEAEVGSELISLVNV